MSVRSSLNDTINSRNKPPMFIELSHPVEDGLVTYPGLPAPVITDFLSREGSRSRYAEGTTFHIGRVDMIGNSGTYVDAPFHRFDGRADIASLPIASLANLSSVVVRMTGRTGRAIDRSAFEGMNLKGKAVLIHTGWSVHWKTPQYAIDHPFLTAEAARLLVNLGIVLVGIDTLNIDDANDGRRPAHTTLLDSGIPIIEHMTALDQLPDSGFRLFAVPPPVRGLGSFPVRAFAILD